SCVHAGCGGRVADCSCFGPTRCSPNTVTSCNPIFIAARGVGFQRQYGALRKPAWLDGEHRSHDRSLCNGLSVRSAALGFAESGFNGGDDRQSDERGIVADGAHVASAAINASRSRTTEKFAASADWFFGGLRGGGCRHLGSTGLGVVDSNRARGFGDRTAIGGMPIWSSPGSRPEDPGQSTLARRSACRVSVFRPASQRLALVTIPSNSIPSGRRPTHCDLVATIRRKATRKSPSTFAEPRNAARMSPSKVNCPSEDNHGAHFAKHSWHFDIAHRRVTNGRYRCGLGDEGPSTRGGDRASCVYQPLGFSRYELPVELVRHYDLRHRRRGRDLAESRHTL